MWSGCFPAGVNLSTALLPLSLLLVSLIPIMKNASKRAFDSCLLYTELCTLYPFPSPGEIVILDSIV